MIDKKKMAAKSEEAAKRRRERELLFGGIYFYFFWGGGCKVESPPSAHPVAAEARAAGQGHVAHVGGRRGGDGLVDDEGAVLEARPPGRLHLPKLLQLFHDVD